MKDIPDFNTFVKIEPIHKGWSNDKKYYVETKDDERLLLRVSDISSYEEKRQQFDIMKKISSTGLKMSCPVSFGICENWEKDVEARLLRDIRHILKKHMSQENQFNFISNAPDSWFTHLAIPLPRENGSNEWLKEVDNSVNGSLRK